MAIVRERDAEAELDLPPGFRFHPTDEELVIDYLCKKVAHRPLPASIIAELDLYDYNPWQLPEKALFGQREWYFFTPRNRKYPKGIRPNRAAGSGYWKATGADKPITPAGARRPVAVKKALVFYEGKASKGTKTNWIMHEYRIADPANNPPDMKGNCRSNMLGASLRLDEWVLCRLYNKKNEWENELQQRNLAAAEEAPVIDSTQSQGTPESGVDNDLASDKAIGVKDDVNQKGDEMDTEDSASLFRNLELLDIQGSEAAFNGGCPSLDMPLFMNLGRVPRNGGSYEREIVRTFS